MLSPMQESVIALSAMKNSMEPIIKSFKRYYNDDDVKFVLQAKVLIDLSSFQEEWCRLDSLCKDNPEVINTKRICQPAIDRINQWDGIRSFRNKALAHGFREEFKEANGRVINSLTDLKRWYFDANVPNAYAEVFLLAEMSYFCMAIFITRHGHEIEGIDVLYKGEIEIKGIDSAKEFDNSMREFMKHIETMEPSLKQSWSNYRFLSEIISAS